MVTAPTGIVVGLDGSEQGNCALIWAAREAQRRRRPLHLVTAYSVPIFAASGLDGGYATVDDDVIRQGAEAVLQQAAAKVADYNIELDARVENGDAAGVLREMSETAELLVFGSRGKGGFVGRLLGSVSSALPAHSKCPTVTVPLSCAGRLGEPVEQASGRHGKSDSININARSAEVLDVVTVGVDGSDRARLAVLLAAEQARRADRTLRVVCAIPPFNGSLSWVPAPLDRDAVFRDINEQLAAGKRWLASHFPGLLIETELVEGPPVEVLIRETKSSELVVLGTRGRGGFAGMLLGSTTDGVLHHAKGPVMVVRDKGGDPRLADRAEFGPVFKG
ncbi:universal stress protein [Paenarthrobacter sp. PH39-S1]|uniref:universal stress protein n=1 Tax=Paenarthrobacter sp. PH39-S1 TaxID=3046204 RepID=UPI0024B90092|nr:universal stress protein [Paenarthrobacter sp. PH39-S1]MDJ0354925.1 universal stress protein [Paenarthrobacter sp. PH39-S1]